MSALTIYLTPGHARRAIELQKKPGSCISTSCLIALAANDVLDENYYAGVGFSTLVVRRKKSFTPFAEYLLTDTLMEVRECFDKHWDYGDGIEFLEKWCGKHELTKIA